MPVFGVDGPSGDGLAGVDLLAAAHDLRTPLDSLTALAAALRDEPLTAAGRDRLAMLEAVIAHLRGVATSLLDEAGGAAAPFSPPDLFGAIGAAAQARADRDGIGFAIQLTDLPALATGRPTALRRIVDNLLDNAFRHGRNVALTVSAAKGHLTIEVRDDGPGIAPADQARLFQPYTRLSRPANPTAQAAAGSGLGLWLVRRTARDLGGDVTLASSVGKGTTITLDVPLAVSSTGNEDPAHAVEPRALTLTGRRALVVDDNPYGRAVVRRILEAFGADVTEADGVGAVKAALDMADPDVVFMDVEMPEGGGAAALATIRRQGGAAPPPVIGVSARGEIGRSAAMAAGFDAYLAKPVEPARLAEAVAVVSQRLRPR